MGTMLHFHFLYFILFYFYEYSCHVHCKAVVPHEVESASLQLLVLSL